MGQKHSSEQNRAKFANKDKLRHLGKMCDEERFRMHDSMQTRMLTPRLTRMMQENKNRAVES